MKSFAHERIQVYVFDHVAELARSAARRVGETISDLLKRRDEVSVYFSGAESQQEFHRALAAAQSIPWHRVNALAVDEFLDKEISPDCAVANEPTRELYSRAAFKSVNLFDSATDDAEGELERYEGLIGRLRPQIACLGIGVSGHIAFNEPGQTYLNDSAKVRIISVSEESKAQLRQDPNFCGFERIPNRAFTVTAAELLRCPFVFVIVPYSIKAPIVRRFFDSEVAADFPATMLKDKAGAELYLDAESMSMSTDVIRTEGDHHA